MRSNAWGLTKVDLCVYAVGSTIAGTGRLLLAEEASWRY